MAISLDSNNTENRQVQVPKEDAELATRLGIKMLAEGGGLELISKAINESQDPAQVIGQFLAQMIGQLAEKLRDQVNLDPKVFLAKDGFLDAILNYIEDKLGYPEEFSDQIYGEVLEIIKAAAMSPAPPNDVTGGEPVQAPTPEEAGVE